MITYRKLEITDIDEFLNLRKKQIIEEGSALPEETVDEMKNYIKSCLQDGTFLSYVAVFNNKIIATSGLSIVNIMPFGLNIKGQIGILNSMYCLPEYRRNGIAKNLLQRIKEDAKSKSVYSIWITGSNQGVMLYDDFGFNKNLNFRQLKL